jgi:hypothetical protein
LASAWIILGTLIKRLAGIQNGLLTRRNQGIFKNLGMERRHVVVTDIQKTGSGERLIIGQKQQADPAAQYDF